MDHTIGRQRGRSTALVELLKNADSTLFIRLPFFYAQDKYNLKTDNGGWLMIITNLTN